MAYLKNSLLYTLLLMQSFLFAKSELPLFQTKQDLRNIRFISKDGKYTYYQRNDGRLFLSTNYKVKEILKGEPLQQYLVAIGKHKKHVVLQSTSHYHEKTSPIKESDLYKALYGQVNTEFIAQGIFTGIHGQNDEWVSYYKPYDKKIILQHLLKKNLKYKVSLVAGRNHYFVPQVVFYDDTLYFTDLNKSGMPAVRSHSLKVKKKSNTLLKSTSVSENLRLCRQEDQLYIWQSSFDQKQRGTRITSLSMGQSKEKDFSFIYESQYNDIPSLICQIGKNHLYFIKKFVDKSKKESFEAIEYHIKSKKIKKLSDIDYASNIINLDGRLLLPHNGKYYSLLDDGNTMELDKLKKGGTK